MVIWHDVEIACPICARRLQIHELGGCFALGQDSDLLVRMEGRHVIQTAIHSCQRCSFSGYAEDFGITIPRSKVERFLSEVSPKLRGKEKTQPYPDIQYHWAYLCAAFLDRPDSELAQRNLRAYWCLRLPPSSELPSNVIEERRKIYLGDAIHHLRQSIRSGASPVQIYLIAELNRRNGEFPTAIGFFKRFLDSSDSERGSVPNYLRLAAMKLLRDAEHGDGRDRTMEEIVYADSTD